MLGEFYSPEFFNDIKNTKVKSALQRITNETQEDLEGYEKVLKEFGCDVIRPDIDKNDSIMNYTDYDGKLTKIPRGPLQPRDAQLVIGNDLFYSGWWDHPGIKQKLTRYDNNFKHISSPLSERSYRNCKDDSAPNWPDYKDYVERFINKQPLSNEPSVHHEIYDLQLADTSFPVYAPCITVIGRDIYVDVSTDMDSVLVNYYFKEFAEMFPSFRINLLNIGGHNDSCFNTIKPGAILSLREIQRYNKTFPDWDVCYLPDQSWKKVEKFTKLKHQNQGKWWVPGEEENDEFTHFVETWLQDWVGYVEETVFDVNVLVLDEKHVCVSQLDNKTVNAFLKKHNMEPVYVPWRHRYFWDGGLHCITLDLVREGTQQDYFPNRRNPITDKGF
jgi:hypothetical protein